MICPNCGAQLPEDVVFCEQCGAYCPAPTFGSATVSDFQSPPPPPPPPKKRKSKTKIFIIIGIIVIIIIGMIIGAVVVINNMNTSDYYPDIQDTYDNYYDDGYSDYGENSEGYSQNIVSVYADADELDNLVSKYVDTADVSLAIASVQNDAFYSYNSNQSQIASALVIFPVVYTYAQMIEDGDMSIYDECIFNYYNDGRTALLRDDAGEYFTYDDLFYYALRYSDNNAINTLIENVGMDTINEYCNNGNYSSVNINKLVAEKSDYDNYISSQDLVNMIKEMYNDGTARSILSNMDCYVEDEYGALGISNQTNPLFSFNGYTGRIYNEIAIIDAPDGFTYVIALLTESDNYSKGCTLASGIGGLYN